MENIRNWRNPDPSVEARIRNTPKFNCLGKSVIVAGQSISMSLLIKSSNERLMMLSDDRSRNFITGIEYRTKFMREVPNLIAFKKKNWPNSRNQLSFEAKSRPGISKEQRTKNEKLKVQQRAKFKDASKSTQVSSNQMKPFFQVNLLRAKITATKMTNESSNASGKRRQPSPSMSGVSNISLERNEPSINKRKMKSENRKVSMKKAFYDSCYEAETEAEKTSVLCLNENERDVEATNRQELCIRLPNSPNSRDSSSLHTTPRSPRLGQKIISTSFIYDSNCNCPKDHDSLKGAMNISTHSNNSIVLHNTIPGLNKIQSTVFTAYLIPILEWIEKDILAYPGERKDVDIGLEISLPCSSCYVVDQKYQIDWTACANMSQFLTTAPKNPHNILSSFDRAFGEGNLVDKKSNKSTVKDETKPNEGLSRSCAINTTNNTVIGPSSNFSNWEKLENAIEVKDHSYNSSNFVPKQFTRPQSASSTTVSQLIPYGKSRPAFDKKTDSKAKRPASSPAIQVAGLIQYVRAKKRPIWK